MKLKYIVPAALAIVLGTGCKKTWLDINSNPSALPYSTPDYLFTGAVNRIAANSLDPHELGSYWSGQWTYSNTYIISTTIFAYQFNNTNFNYWDGWFDILKDLQQAIEQADATGQPYMKGPAKIMKAYLMQQIVDCYGNAPFSDAWKGSASLAPKFDDQKDIYANLIKLLDDAIVDLKANAFQPQGTAADIVLQGKVTNWVRFANSLKLRILIRQSRVAGSSTYITTEINKAAATTEGFLNSGQDVGSNPGYLQSTGKMNPYYERWGYNSSGSSQAIARLPRPTKFLGDFLKATLDTFRLKRIAYANGGENSATPGVSLLPEIVANYNFVPFGIGSGYAAPSTPYPGPSVIVRNQFSRPMPLMPAYESFFLLAEAKQLYGAAVTLPALGTDGTAKGYYEQGVKESFRFTGTAASAATTLLSSGIDMADWNASPDKLKAIWMQKWVAMVNFQGLEAWSEFRRTNFPNIPASATAPAGQKLPVRLFYPSTEAGSNPNVPTGIDVFTSRLFWDVD
jgi:hypothetical protein